VYGLRIDEGRFSEKSNRGPPVTGIVADTRVTSIHGPPFSDLSTMYSEIVPPPALSACDHFKSTHRARGVAASPWGGPGTSTALIMLIMKTFSKPNAALAG
jgi:hypothetical protein